MSLHYILDGYNIVRHADFIEQDNLRDPRLSLVRLLEQLRPFGSLKNKVTIVFDGSSNVITHPIQSSIEVKFSCPESADDEIKRLVERSKTPKQIIVVSDDRELTFYVRSLGAAILSASDFLLKCRLLTDKPKYKPNVELSYSEMEKINEELRKKWLK